MESAGAVPGSTPGLSKVFLPGNAARHMGLKNPELAHLMPSSSRPAQERRSGPAGQFGSTWKVHPVGGVWFATRLTDTPCGEQASVRVGSTPALPTVLATVPPSHKERAYPARDTACVVHRQDCGIYENICGYTLTPILPGLKGSTSPCAASHIDGARRRGLSRGWPVHPFARFFIRQAERERRGRGVDEVRSRRCFVPGRDVVGRSPVRIRKG